MEMGAPHMVIPLGLKEELLKSPIRGTKYDSCVNHDASRSQQSVSRLSSEDRTAEAGYAR